MVVIAVNSDGIDSGLLILINRDIFIKKVIY